MAESFLIDSNVIIDYMGEKFPISAKYRLNSVFDILFHYSMITRMEVLGFNTSVFVIERLSSFLDQGKQFNIDAPICDKVIEIRRKLKIDLPDAIIAATALVNNCILLTRNLSDFKNIPGLTVENPHDWV